MQCREERSNMLVQMQYCSKNKKAGLYNYKPPNNNVLQYLDVEFLA